MVLLKIGLVLLAWCHLYVSYLHPAGSHSQLGGLSKTKSDLSGSYQLKYFFIWSL